MKKVVTLLLCLLMIVPLVLCACNNSGDDEGETTQATTLPSAEEQEKDATIENWLPIQSYGVDGGKRQVNMLTCKDYNRKYYFFRTDDGNGDTLAASSYRRFCKMEETYDVVMQTIEPTDGDILHTLSSSLMGQGGEYDLVYPHPTSEMQAILENGFYENLYNYENIHLEQPWWSQNQVNSYTIDDKLYIAVSDFSLSGQGFIGLIFNREIYNDLQIEEDLYDLVENNAWTIAKMREIVMKYGTDSNGDDKYDENDHYGFIYQPQHTKNFYWSFGGKIVEKDGNNDYYLAIDNDTTNTMATALYNLAYNSENKVFVSNPCVYDTFADSNGWAMFKSRQGLFMTYDLGGLYSHLNEIQFKIGYLPYPKLTDEQTEYPVVCAAGFFAIPKKAPDAVMSSVLLEACSIYSYSNYRPTFFNTILLGRMSEQAEDYAMLEFLHENKVFDMGFTFPAGGSDNLLYWAVVGDGEPGALASFIQARWRDMDDTLDYIENIRNGKFEG